MLTFMLRRLRVSVVLLAPFARLQRKFLKQVLTIFGGADKAPRLQALLFIRHMAAALPPPALELALKVHALDFCFLLCLAVWLKSQKFVIWVWVLGCPGRNCTCPHDWLLCLSYASPFGCLMSHFHVLQVVALSVKCVLEISCYYLRRLTFVCYAGRVSQLRPECQVRQCRQCTSHSLHGQLRGGNVWLGHWQHHISRLSPASGSWQCC